MPPEPIRTRGNMPPITDRDQRILDALELIGAGIHTIAHDLHRAVEFLDRHGAVLDAYQRGGFLAARTARKQNGRRDALPPNGT